MKTIQFSHFNMHTIHCYDLYIHKITNCQFYEKTTAEVEGIRSLYRQPQVKRTHRAAPFHATPPPPNKCPRPILIQWKRLLLLEAAITKPCSMISREACCTRRQFRHSDVGCSERVWYRLRTDTDCVQSEISASEDVAEHPFVPFACMELKTSFKITRSIFTARAQRQARFVRHALWSPDRINFLLQIVSGGF